jgi:uncharacterized protein (DUF362 family)
MKNRIDRRKFIKQSVAVGITAAVGSASLSSLLLGNSLEPKIDIFIVNGTEYFANTLKAIEGLGGMGTFVRKGSKVGLLINSFCDKRGTYANPDIALAVLKMCIDAGVKEIYSIAGVSKNYWKRSNLYNKFEQDINRIQWDGTKITTKVAKGKSLKEAEISKILLECDTFINIPIVKNHEGTQFTGNLKNVMGACSSSTNRFFHQGSGKGGLLRYFRYYDNIEFLSQCIADVNSIRKPDLCIVDATEFITTNGPAGPGELKQAQKIVAGTNCVSVDAYCATLLGMKPDDVLMVRYASELGLGEKDLSKLAIKEI